MNASTLKALHLKQNPESQFFTRDNMRHGRDTMRNFGVRKNPAGGWILYRKKATVMLAEFCFSAEGKYLGRVGCMRSA